MRTGIVILCVCAGWLLSASVKPSVAPVSLTPDTCRCNPGGPLYPGGNELFHQVILEKTLAVIQPENHGTVYVEFVIDETGALVNPIVRRSVDPGFEAVLLKKMRASEKWIPACRYTDDFIWDEEGETGRIGECISIKYIQPFKI